MKPMSVMPSDNDWRILRVIIARIEEQGGVYGCPRLPDSDDLPCQMPMHEIAEASGVNPAMVHKHIHRLLRRGIIRRRPSHGATPSIYFMSVAAFLSLRDAIGYLVGWNEWRPSGQGNFRKSS